MHLHSVGWMVLQQLYINNNSSSLSINTYGTNILPVIKFLIK